MEHCNNVTVCVNYHHQHLNGSIVAGVVLFTVTKQTTQYLEAAEGQNSHIRQDKTAPVFSNRIIESMNNGCSRSFSVYLYIQ